MARFLIIILIFYFCILSGHNHFDEKDSWNHSSSGEAITAVPSDDDCPECRLLSFEGQKLASPVFAFAFVFLSLPEIPQYSSFLNLATPVLSSARPRAPPSSP